MKTLKKSSFIFVILGVIMIFASLFSFAPKLAASADNYTQDSLSTVDVAALDKNGDDITATRTRYIDTYDNNPLNEYNWSAVTKFRVNFSMSESDFTNPPAELNYHIRVEYVNKYSEDMLQKDGDKPFEQAASRQTYNLPSMKTTSLSSIASQEFDVANMKDSINDANARALSNENSEDKECFGWGIYRFSIVFENVDSKTFYSEYQALKPTRFQGTPSIDYEITSSKTGLRNAYNFYLTNEDIDFIDVSSITWYVEGESTTGKKFVLTEKDLEDNENFDNALYKTADKLARTGVTFYFDSNNIAGKWKVYCMVNNYGEPEAIKSDVKEVETGTRISTSTIIWFIVGGVLLLVIIIVVIIVVTKKKEKVW